jgi:hypothetical protein
MIPAGGLVLERQRSVRPHYPILPVKVLSHMFRGNFNSGLKFRFPPRANQVPRRPTEC